MSGGQISDILDRIAEHTRAAPHHARLRQHPQDGRAGGPPADRAAGRGRAPGRRAAATSTPRCWWRPTTAASRRRAGASSRRACAPATCARWSPPPRSSWASTSGPVELVCQIGSPRAIGTFLQRVGRANHQRDGTPAGRLYPTTRDELVECTALLAAVRAGRLDLLEPPVAPLDVLTQQVVAEVAAADEREVEALWRADPARPRPTPSCRGRTSTRWWRWPAGGSRRGGGAAARTCTTTPSTAGCGPGAGARLAALTGGGAIPETGDYRVVLDPDGVTVGSVHEDFAVEATAGDIFLLGTHSWRVAKVEVGTVRVHDAGDLPPTDPVLAGRGAGPHGRALRGGERSAGRRSSRCCAPATATGARRLVRERAGVSAEVAQQVVAYLRRRPGRPRPPADPRAHRGRALLRRQRGTRSSSSTRPSAAASTAPSAWRCASASACRSTSSCRRRRTTTPWCSRSAPSTASR